MTITEQACVPCSGNMEALSKKDAEAKLNELGNDWVLDDAGKELGEGQRNDPCDLVVTAVFLERSQRSFLVWKEIVGHRLTIY